MLSFPDLFKQHRPPSTPFPEASEISPAHHAEVEVDKDRDRDAEGWGRSERIDNQCLKQRLTGRQAVTRARVVGWGRKGVAFEAHRLGRHCPSCPRVHSVVDRRRVHYSMHDEEKNSRALLWAHWKIPIAYHSTSSSQHSDMEAEARRGGYWLCGRINPAGGRVRSLSWLSDVPAAGTGGRPANGRRSWHYSRGPRPWWREPRPLTS